MLNALQPWHIIVLVVVLVALFGAKRLPDAARGIGKSMHIFKAEAKNLRDEHDAAKEAESSTDDGAEQPAARQVEPARQVESAPGASAPRGVDEQHRTAH